MKKKKAWLIDVAYWTFILFSAIRWIMIDEDLKAINIMDIFRPEFTSQIRFQMITALFILLITSVFFALFRNFLITIIYIGTKIAYKKHLKDKLDETDYKSKTYFREKLEKYSVAVLSYIDDFKIDQKDIVSTLLCLKLKKKIDIKNIIKVTSENVDELSNNEKYVFNKLKEGNLKSIDMAEFEAHVINDCKAKGILEEKKDIRENIKKNIIYASIIFLIIIILYSYVGHAFEGVEGGLAQVIYFGAILIFLVSLALFPGIVIVNIVQYIKLNSRNPYVRSKEGKILNTKLDGLKNYLNDFSLLEEKKEEDLVLWEEYLIYSVMFGMNNKLVEDIYSKAN